MPLFPELVAELNNVLAKRRASISPPHVPPERELLADPVREPIWLDGHTVYLKQKVLSQIRQYEARKELYLSTILPATPAAPAEEVVAPASPPSGWSIWRVFGY